MHNCKKPGIKKLTFIIEENQIMISEVALDFLLLSYYSVSMRVLWAYAIRPFMSREITSVKQMMGFSAIPDIRQNFQGLFNISLLLKDFQNHKIFHKSPTNRCAPPCPKTSMIVLLSGLKRTLIMELLISLWIKVWLFSLFSV